MKERPILFSGSMVRAVLADRKRQTRRLVKPCKDRDFGCELTPHEIAGEANAGRLRNCPYGEPGTHLWVRESFSGPHCMEATPGCAAVPPSKWGHSSRIWYWADGNPSDGDWTRPRPSIHMPRWASRITLEITGIRVERLQEISVEDAMAEGVVETRATLQDLGPCLEWRYAFEDLWEQLNGPGSWAINPWVWVVEFRRVLA